jgi:hypothetical protein
MLAISTGLGAGITKHPHGKYQRRCVEKDYNTIKKISTYGATASISDDRTEIILLDVIEVTSIVNANT